MVPQRYHPLLLAAVGLLLVTNPVWLVPHEGETPHTYERSRVTVEDGTLTYPNAGVGPFDDENDLTALDCVDPDTSRLRACALDRHLVDLPPITLPRRAPHDTDPHFVRIDDTYYRRITDYNWSTNPTTVTLDVERVPARTVLTESAHNLSDRPTAPPGLSVRFQVLYSGDSRRSFTELSDDALGEIYALDGAYYVVVRTDERVVDHGPFLHDFQYEVPRYTLSAIGVLLLVVGLLMWPE